MYFSIFKQNRDEFHLSELFTEKKTQDFFKLILKIRGKVVVNLNNKKRKCYLYTTSFWKQFSPPEVVAQAYNPSTSEGGVGGSL